MPLTRPIPKAAMPVVRVLMRDVKRPKELPYKQCYGKQPPNWGVRCAMWWHPKSTRWKPEFAQEFAGGECTQEAVSAFGQWWDEQEMDDAEAAVDAVWPRKVKR